MPADPEAKTIIRAQTVQIANVYNRETLKWALQDEPQVKAYRTFHLTCKQVLEEGDEI